VLQERTLYRLGGRSEVAVDVRIIAATHKDLAAEALAGRFRHDLFYRLSVFELVVPPLRERRGDVLPLAEHFLARAGQARGVDGLHLGEGARGLIAAYDWPGNVRELRNAMERAAVLAQDTRITPRDLPPRILQCLETRSPAAPGPDSYAATASPPTTSGSGALEAHTSFTETPETSSWRPIEQVERDMIVHALATKNNNVSAVIRRLQIPRTSLYRKLRAYGINP
jgi:DNA-binding NtrC family response regulator